MPVFEERIITVGDVRLNVISNGNPENPSIFFLHGFPSFSGIWKDVIEAFSDRFYCHAPDLRGYNLSSKPTEIEAYRTDAIVGDVKELIRIFSPTAPAVVIGHDFGGWIAYATAIDAPELVSDLVVVNGVHPAAYRAALSSDQEQVEASQYIHFLRSPNAVSELSKNGSELLLNSYARMTGRTSLTPEERQAHLSAWAQPGAIQAMLNWYIANDFQVPKIGDRPDPKPIFDTEEWRIKPRHLLIWGEKDPFLRPSCHNGLEVYCDDLTKVIVAEASHWTPGSDLDRFVNEVGNFLKASSHSGGRKSA